MGKNAVSDYVFYKKSTLNIKAQIKRKEMDKDITCYH